MSTVHRGHVRLYDQEYNYVSHFGGKAVLTGAIHLNQDQGWSTARGNWDECPTFVRNAIQADITAKEVERCIRGV